MTAKKKSRETTARALGSIGACLAFYSMFQASMRGARYGYEEALLYLVPAVVLAIISIAMHRSRRVWMLFIATLLLIAGHVVA